MSTSKFTTTELSDPRFESNNLRFITVKTPNLKGRGDICVFVPENCENKTGLPIITLMHGVYGSAWIWAHKAGVHFTAQRLIDEGKLQPIILAMPSDGLWGDGSAYLPHNELNFENWIVKDVPDAVKESIPQANKNSKQCISGLSMGGYGALRLGLKYYNQYTAVSGHSSITAIDQMPLFVEEDVKVYQQKTVAENAVIQIAIDNKENLPPFRFDCGKEDLLIEYNRKLHKELVEANIDHVYEEFEGEHEWSYWKKHIEDTLLFFDGILKKNKNHDY